MKKYGLLIILLLTTGFSSADTQTWYLVRHFEKQAGDNPSLTKQGQSRAESLAAYFAEQPLSHIYSTQYKRTTETASAVANRLNATVDFYDPRELKKFALTLQNHNNALIVGHSNTTPELLALLGGDKVEISEGDFGVLYILQKDGTKFTTSTRKIPIN